jgi:nucleoside-diphosphate-sugar epimerase
MKFAVTGAAGFVGGALCELLVQQFGTDSVQAVVGPAPIHDKERARHQRLQRMGVRIVSSDLRKSPVPWEPLEEFDVLFHLAAYVKTEENSPDVHINDEGVDRLIQELGRASKVAASSIPAAL